MRTSRILARECTARNRAFTPWGRLERRNIADSGYRRFRSMSAGTGWTPCPALGAGAAEDG